ncbi:MAG: hypothetical protein HYY84_06565 [Deltaproteobacteria bacterium]|nr:hypothetical protein [Deltaproteobacteria bacterium]
MRVLATGGIKANKTLRAVVLGALGLLALHGLASIAHFTVKFHFSAAEVERFYFGAPELPEPISATYVFENLHTALFVFGFLFLTLAALIMQTPHSLRVRLGFLCALFVFGLADSLSGLVLLAVGRSCAVLKVASFCLFQLSFFAAIAAITRHLVTPNGNGVDRPPGSNYRLAVTAFAILNIGFAAGNAALLFSKFGASTAAIARHFVGDPDGFSRPQSLESLLEVSAVHFVTVALYLLALIHFMFMRLGREPEPGESDASFIRWRLISQFLAIALFATALLNLGSGFLVRFVSADAAIVKLAASLGFSAALVGASVVLFRALWVARPVSHEP